MARESTGSAKRFGVRYGRKNREKVGRAEQQYRTRNKSPFCNKTTVSRIAAGIFKCSKTGHIFTGRAYSPKSSDTKR
jgi:large subunit ribosomal protein L37Ae